MKAAACFLVLECLETPMKHEARVYEMAPQKGLISNKHKSKTKIMSVFGFCFLLFH